MTHHADEPVMTERTIPPYPIQLVLFGATAQSARAYADAGDVALWLSLVLEDATEDERWLLRKLRDEFENIAHARNGREARTVTS